MSTRKEVALVANEQLSMGKFSLPTRTAFVQNNALNGNNANGLARIEKAAQPAQKFINFTPVPLPPKTSGPPIISKNDIFLGIIENAEMGGAGYADAIINIEATTKTIFDKYLTIKAEYNDGSEYYEYVLGSEYFDHYRRKWKREAGTYYYTDQEWAAELDVDKIKELTKPAVSLTMNQYKTNIDDMRGTNYLEQSLPKEIRTCGTNKEGNRRIFEVNIGTDENPKWVHESELVYATNRRGYPAFYTKEQLIPLLVLDFHQFQAYEEFVDLPPDFEDVWKLTSALADSLTPEEAMAIDISFLPSQKGYIENRPPVDIEGAPTIFQSIPDKIFGKQIQFLLENDSEYVLPVIVNEFMKYYKEEGLPLPSFMHEGKLESMLPLLIPYFAVEGKSLGFENMTFELDTTFAAVDKDIKNGKYDFDYWLTEKKKEIATAVVVTSDVVVGFVGRPVEALVDFGVQVGSGAVGVAGTVVTAPFDGSKRCIAQLLVTNFIR